MIAIIAVLASLLLPVLNKAKAKAKQIQCLSNIRNLTLPPSMYADDHDDAVPYFNAGDSSFHNLLEPYVGQPQRGDWHKGHWQEPDLQGLGSQF